MTELATQIFDRLPPHDLEAERALIGSLCLKMTPGAVARVRVLVQREDFYSADHQILFDAICTMKDKGIPVDAVMLRADLVRRQLLEEIGGSAYLGQILNSVPSSAHAEHYAKLVREKSKLRQCIALSNDLLRACYSPSSDESYADDLLNKLSYEARRIAMTGRPLEIHTLESVWHEILERRDTGPVNRVSCGLPRLDSALGGLRIGSKTLVAGRPGMGKSQLVKQITLNLAAGGKRAGLITIEESRQKVAENLLANISAVPNYRITSGNLCEEEWEGVVAAMSQNAETAGRFWIVDSVRSLSAIENAARQLKENHGCEVILVDHLHIIDPETSKRENREQQVSTISQGLKWLWKELNVAGIEAAQLNRGQRGDRPVLENLRDSGTLEQDADVVMMLYREDYYRNAAKQRGENAEPNDGIMEVIVAKNKDAGPATVCLHFDGDHQMIRDLTDVEVAAMSAPGDYPY